MGQRIAPSGATSGRGTDPACDDDRMVYLFAHRGGFDSGHRENTIPALADALAAGASLETDVRLSLDGVPVLVHDSYLTGTTWLPRRVRRLSTSRLESMGVTPLRRLYEELGSSYQLSIDVKDPDAGLATIAVAREVGDVSRLWLVHDSIHVLQRLRRADPDVRLVHETRMRVLARTETTPEAHMDLLARWQVDAQNTHWSRWTPALLAAARERGLLAFGSIAQLPHQMERALRTGLDGLYTDHVRDLVRVARELGIETTP